MTDKQLSSAGSVIQDTLTAAAAALGYAAEHAIGAGFDGLDHDRIAHLLEDASRAVRAAEKQTAARDVVRGYVANAVSHLRAGLRAMQDRPTEQGPLTTATRATARALSLLYPLIQTEGPILLVQRKSGKKSRRNAPVLDSAKQKTLPRITVDLGPDTETNFYTGFEQDISTGGLFIATYDIHPIGTSLIVSVRFPRGRNLEETATVRFVREFNDTNPEIAPGFGVTFDKITAKAKKQIAQFMTKREALFYEAV